MKSRPVIWALALVALVALGALGWYLASPLFINRTVDEAFPTAMAAVEAQPSATLPATEAAEMENTAMEATPEGEMEGSMPEDGGQEGLLKQGQFADADSFHQGSGKAAIYVLEDGSRVLRFEDFMVTNGPDLHVFLSSVPHPAGPDDMGESVDLGALKGNQGNQNYGIPGDLELDRFQSVLIYCVPFHVLFSYASLSN